MKVVGDYKVSWGVYINVFSPAKGSLVKYSIQGYPGLLSFVSVAEILLKSFKSRIEHNNIPYPQVSGHSARQTVFFTCFFIKLTRLRVQRKH